MATEPEEFATRDAVPAEPQISAQATIAAAVAADPNLETATLTLPKEALDFLRGEAKRRNISTGDMVRLAIGTQKFLSEKAAAGAKVQIKDNGRTFDMDF